VTYRVPRAVEDGRIGLRTQLYLGWDRRRSRLWRGADERRDHGDFSIPGVRGKPNNLKVKPLKMPTV
jgi:hypothetical protein